MKQPTEKPTIMVDVVTRVPQPMAFGDIFRCADGDIFLAQPQGPAPRAVALLTTDNEHERVEGEAYALMPNNIRPPYTLIVSLMDHLHD